MRGPIFLLSIFVVVFVAVLVLVLAKLKSRSGGAAVSDYSKKRTLLSPAERSFLGVLEQAVGDGYRVFGKVRVADVLEPRRGMDRSNHQTALNRISAKHFDFVLCAPGDLSIVCAVELDDASHQRAARRDRDAFLVAACRAASLPLVQVKAARTYSIDDLKDTLAAALGPGRAEHVPRP
jgi:uncharacterized protein DUF2726